MTYDKRRRNTEIESNRRIALKSLAQTERALHMLQHRWLDEPIRLSVLMDVGGPSIDVATSLGRELAFVLSHTVHHNAIIGVIAKALDVPVPERFGYAPSTLAHMGKRLCAR